MTRVTIGRDNHHMAWRVLELRYTAGSSLRALVRGSSRGSSLSITLNSSSYTRVKTWQQRWQSQKMFHAV